MSIDIIGIASTHRIPIKHDFRRAGEIEPNPNGSSRGKCRPYSSFKAKHEIFVWIIDHTYINAFLSFTLYNYNTAPSEAPFLSFPFSFGLLPYLTTFVYMQFSSSLI